MKRRDIYRVQFIGGNWVLGGPGVAKDARWFALKTSAIHAGAALARSRWQTFGKLGQLVIHNRDGKIQSERTYGKDPRRHRG